MFTIKYKQIQGKTIPHDGLYHSISLSLPSLLQYTQQCPGFGLNCVSEPVFTLLLSVWKWVSQSFPLNW